MCGGTLNAALRRATWRSAPCSDLKNQFYRLILQLRIEAGLSMGGSGCFISLSCLSGGGVIGLVLVYSAHSLSRLSGGGGMGPENVLASILSAAYPAGGL